MKKIVVAGGSGFIGTALVSRLIEKGYKVVVLDLSPPRATGADFVQGNIATSIPSNSLLDKPYAIINLAGFSVNNRFTEKNKALIRSSRTKSTANLVEWTKQQEHKPRIFINASAVGYYGDTGEQSFDEDATPGTSFLSRVVEDWEASFSSDNSHIARTAIIRQAHVLGSGGGYLQGMLITKRVGITPILGDPSNWVPWVHIDDLVRLYITILEDPRLSGTFNAVAPYLVRSREFSKHLHRLTNTLVVLPVPMWALRLKFLEGADNLFTSQRITSKYHDLLDTYQHQHIKDALTDCV